MLFGRRTYEDFFKVWPNRTDNPFSAVLDNAEKYVASRTLTEPLPWKNSTLLKGDAAEAVAAAEGSSPARTSWCWAAANSCRRLMRHGLVDEFMLLIHPLVLGSGRRLFRDDGPFAALRLVTV